MAASKTTTKKSTVTTAKKQPKTQIVSYEIPSSFNPFEMGERIIRVEEELKHQRELMIEGFKMMNKRFEDVDKRFEDMNKRFEDMQRNTDKRFESMDKRFEDMNKRFEDMQKYMDKRFNIVFWIMASGFAGTWSILGILLSRLG